MCKLNKTKQKWKIPNYYNLLDNESFFVLIARWPSQEPGPIDFRGWGPLAQFKTITRNTGRSILINSRMFCFVFSSHPSWMWHIVPICCAVLQHPAKIEVMMRWRMKPVEMVLARVLWGLYLQKVTASRLCTCSAPCWCYVRCLDSVGFVTSVTLHRSVSLSKSLTSKSLGNLGPQQFHRVIYQGPVSERGFSKLEVPT